MIENAELCLSGPKQDILVIAKIPHAYHTKLVALSRALLEMKMSICFGVIKAGCNRANTIIELAANVAL